MAQLKDLLVNGSARVIGSLFANLSGNVLNFGVCSTAAATAAKTVTTNGTFELITGSKILVLFSETDTSNAPTLNVNGTGAKSIKINASDGIGKGFLAAQQYYWFIYDGTNWRTAGAGITQIIPIQYGGTNNNSFTANRPLFYNGTRIIGSTTNYINDTQLAINKTSITSGYNFEVNGNSNLIGSVTVGTSTSGALGIAQTDGAGRGISLYNGPVATGIPYYGIAFAKTATFGTHGAVTSDWATYFTMSDTTTRGWIFRRGSTNVASIDGTGKLYLGYAASTANPGIYWNPYVESASDGSDVSAIYQIKSGVAGGTELRILQANDSDDVINIVSPYYIYLNSKRAFKINDTWLRINEDKGFSEGIYTGSSLVRTDNQFQVGDSGNKFYANSSGNGYFSNTLGIAGTNTSYKLYVKGTSYFTETITGDILSAWHLLAGRPSNTTNFRTYFETIANLHHDNPARTDSEISYNRWFANNSDQTNYSPAKLNLPVVDQHVLSFGIDNVAAYSRHIAFDIRTNAVYVGARNNNTWSNWEQLVRNTGTWNISITGNANTVDNLHASDFVRAYNTTNDNIDSDWGQSIKTFDPIPSGTPPEQNPNITLLSLGNSFARRKELAFTYSNNNIYYRRRTDNTFSNWVKLIHSGNYTDYTVTKTGSGATGTWNISVTGTATRLATFKVTTNDNNNASGYFLVYTWTISIWSNHRMSFIVTSRHTGGGLVTISCGNNTGTLSQANAYAEIYYWGPISSGDIISADSWQIYVSADGSKAYLFAKYNDYNEAVITPLSADAPSKSTWMTSINTATYGTLKANTNYNTVRPLAKKLTIQANGTQKGQFNNSADVTVNLGNVAQDFTGANSGNAANINADTFAGMTKQQWLNTVYPIGSIYTSVNSTNPEVLFGGTWESLGGRFLIGQDGTYIAGSTGGSTTHTHTQVATTSGGPSNNTSGGPSNNTSGGPSTNTSGGTAITVAQMPAHSHPENYRMQYNGGTEYGSNHVMIMQGYWDWRDNKSGKYRKSTTGTAAVNTNNTGSGQAHTHTLSSHTHSLQSHTHSLQSHTHTTAATTTGGASTLPPYLAVYMWKRTA